MLREAEVRSGEVPVNTGPREPMLLSCCEMWGFWGLVKYEEGSAFPERGVGATQKPPSALLCSLLGGSQSTQRNPFILTPPLFDPGHWESEKKCNLSITTHPVRLTVLIPNSQIPCLLNCLLGDHITSSSRVQVHISPISVVMEKILPSTPALHFPSYHSIVTLLQCKVDPTGQQGWNLCLQLGSPVQRAGLSICVWTPEMARGQRTVPSLTVSSCFHLLPLRMCFTDDCIPPTPHPLPWRLCKE